MNRGLNLPQIQKIMNEFEKESSMMDMKEEMMSDAVDDVMEDDLEDEELEGDKILKEVLDEIGVDLSQQVGSLLTHPANCLRLAVAYGCSHWRHCAVNSTDRTTTSNCNRRNSRDYQFSTERRIGRWWGWSDR
jgi:hypothetical protein